MIKLGNTAAWIWRNIFFITITPLLIVYLRWFRLTPFMFGSNDPDFAYIVGLILLAIYGLFAFLIKRAKNHRYMKGFLFFPATIIFLINIWHANAFFPSLEVTSKCNGNTYYISWMHPFGDYQWSVDNVTIWRRFLSYESFFFGYSGGPYKIVCDDERNEANIIDISRKVLVYIDGENSQSFDRYAGIQQADNRYFLAWQCNNWFPSTCTTETYTLYQCNLEFKSCAPLPLQYTTENGNSFVFETDERADEIRLYDDFDDNPDRTLIFTWGKNPRCYAEGCEYLEK
jgi:hypothetical protein